MFLIAIFIFLSSVFLAFIFIQQYKMNSSSRYMNYVFINYTSSYLEKQWLNTIYNYRDNYSAIYCSLITPFYNRLNALKKQIDECKKYLDKKCGGNDLSFFVYKSKTGLIKEYIEPLFGILRNTFSICYSGKKGNLGDKNYLLPSYILALHKPIIYIDAGASTFNKGIGGSSQSYFYNFYKNNSNAKFGGWYLWEITKQNIKKVRQEIPIDLKNIYHYFNRPISFYNESKDNPITFIKKYQIEDYIIFKLDIDRPLIELPIFENILNDNNIVLNEFYFEYHFYEPFMMKNGWKNDVDYNCSLYCATLKFLQLRKKGIRAHPWV